MDDMMINIEVDDADTLPNNLCAEGFRIFRLHFDNEKEYKLIDNDIAHQDIDKTFSAPYTP
jgi:hypothetical protein